MSSILGEILCGILKINSNEKRRYEEYIILANVPLKKKKFGEELTTIKQFSLNYGIWHNAKRYTTVNYIKGDIICVKNKLNSPSSMDK